MRYLVVKWHCNGATEFGKCEKSDPAKVVEALQREKAREGRPSGVTWKVVEGSISDALVASASI